MQTSESIKAVSEALLKAQGDLVNPINTATNPHFKNKYPQLPEILAEVRPALAKHGLVVIQSVEGDEVGTALVSTRLLHKSGEFIESGTLLLTGHKPDAQGTGSAITYGRRYSLLALLGLAGDDDDDGHAAAKRGGGNGNAPPPEKPKTKKETFDLLDASCADFGIPTSAVKAALLARHKLGKDAAAKLTKAQIQKAIDGLDEFVAEARNFVADNGGLLD